MKKIITISILCLMAFAAFAQSTNTFEYDNLNRLTKVTYANGVIVQYTYDALGNRLSKTVTGNIQLPVVTTATVTQLGSTTAVCGGNVTEDGGSTVTARGVCWSTSPNPTVSDSHTTDGTGTGSFTSSITDLTPNTTYYVRAYATNSAGTTYGEQKSFKTSCNAVNVSIAGTTTISYGGNTTLTASGANSYSWSTGSASASITVSPSSTTTYTVTGTNSYGCTGTASVTVTVNSLAPSVVTNSVTNVSTTSAICGGNVTSDGGTTVTARGVCWSTNHNPTIADAHTNDGTGTGSFTSNLMGLTPNTTYYVRAYSTNSMGTAYGEELSFTTAEGITCSITIEMHDSFGDGWNGNKILVHNNDTVQEVTLVSGRNGTVTLAVYEDSLELQWVNGSYVGECSFTITGPCLYYSGGAPAQGVFLTTEIDCEAGVPAVPAFTYTTENTCNSVIVHFDNNSSNANAAIWSMGDYSTDEWNPTYEFTSSGTYPVTLSVSNTACEELHTITNNVTVTMPEPIVTVHDTTLCAADLPITWYGHTFTGTETYVETLSTADGCDSTVTLNVTVGVKTAFLEDNFNDGVINTDKWTYTGNAVIEEDGLLKLQQNVTDQDVHLRSMNIGVPADGKVNMDRRFMVHRNSNYYYGSTYFYFNGSSENNNFVGIQYNYGAYEGWYGIHLVYKLNGAADETRVRLCDATFDSWVTEHVELDLSAGTLSYYLDTLVATISILGFSGQSVDYYNVEFRPFGWWTGHQHYMDYVRIYGSESLELVTTSPVSGITATEATCGGNIPANECLFFSERGVCWSTDHNPTIADAHTNDGAGTGSFTSNLTGLTPNTTYYVRAYSTNSMGTAYGEELSFTTADVASCSITIEMHDSYGDGWNGNKILMHGQDTVYEVTLGSGSNGTETLAVYEGPLELQWVNGNYVGECSFTITGPCLYYSGGAPAQGVFLTAELNCEAGEPAIPAFTYTTENTCNSVIVHFDNNSSNADVATWSIGGNSTNEWNPTYEFTSSGTYPVTLSVSNTACEELHTVTNNVMVTMPEPIVTVHDTALCASELPITWYGHTFTGTETYDTVLQAVNGCDSAVTLKVYAPEDGLVSISLGATYYAQVASNERFVTIADYNDDNHADLITRIHPTGEIRFYKNTGTTMQYDFSLNAQPYAFSASCDENNNGQSNALSCLKDFDNDGVKDLLVYGANHNNCSSNSVRIYWGAINLPYFNDTVFTELNITSPYCVGAYSADLNNDSLEDVLIRNCGPTNLYMNNGNRVFTKTSVFNTGRDISVIFDDYDLDGNVDLCYTKNGWASGGWGIRLNKGNGDGTFNTSTISNYDNEHPIDGFLNFQSDPLDDNIPDIAFTCNNDGTNNSRVYIGEWDNSVGNFQFATLDVPVSDETRIVQAFDINGDTYEDLIVRLKTGNTYSAKAYVNDGRGHFSYVVPIMSNKPYYPYKLWRDGEQILMAVYHGTARDSILVYKLDANVCESLCANLVALPYFENFDSYTQSTETATGVEPPCWELVQEDVTMTADKLPQLYRKSSYAHSGKYSLLLNGRCVYAMPALAEPLEVPISQLKLEMYVRQSKAQYMLQVGIWEDDGTFVPVATVNNQSTDVEHVVCSFAGYTGNGRRIAFRNVLAKGYSSKYSVNSIDDISLTDICEPVTLPYSEDFELYTQSTTTATGVEPPCWELVQEDVTMTADKLPQLYRKSSYAHSGKYSLLLNGRCVYAMPALAEPLEVPISQIKLEMYVRQSKAQYMLQVGVWEDDGTFVPVATVNNQSTDVEHVVCSFAGYTGNGRRIAFRNVLAKGYTSKYSVNSIDDIRLTDICEPVTLPYSEDFELYTQSTTTATGVEPPCWELVQEDVTMTADKLPQLYRKSSYAHSGKYSLLLNGRGVYAMPSLAEPLEVPINQIKLEMYVCQTKPQNMLEVGIWEDDGTFVPVATVNNQSTDVEHVVCSFAGYTGNGRRIAFRNVLAKGYTSKYSVNFIDDIRLTDICEPVTLPYSEDFELYTQSTETATGVEPPCWELVQKDVAIAADKLPQLYRKASYAHSGKYSLLLNGRCVYAMPSLAEPLEVPISQLKLDMYVCQTKPQNMLEVGIWEDDGTFVPVDTVNNQSTDVEHVVCSFAGYTGPGHRIAFRNVLANGYSSKNSVNFIDDINITSVGNKNMDVTNAGAAYPSETDASGEMAVSRYLENITLYPNPTTGVVHIDAAEVQRVECYTMMGQVVAEYNEVRDIDISQLTAGVYMLRITLPQGVIMRKVVKR